MASSNYVDTDPATIEEKQFPVPHRITSTKYTRTLSLSGWSIATSKCPISNAREIDEAAGRLDIPLPEMIFGNNYVLLSHAASGTEMRWTAFDALDTVDKTGTDLKVSYSENWNATRDEHSEEIKHVTRPFDWTYSPDYRGTTIMSSSLSTDPPPPADPKNRDDNNEQGRGAGGRDEWVETEETLPMALLQRQDPILFYDDVILYESELDDNGTSLLSLRIRVMPNRLLLLSRFFMRLDDVLFRVRDVRVYVAFDDADDTPLKTTATGTDAPGENQESGSGRGKVLRECLVREASYASVRGKIKPYQADELGTLLNDANWVAQQCPIVHGAMETLRPK